MAIAIHLYRTASKILIEGKLALTFFLYAEICILLITGNREEWQRGRLT